MVLGEDTVLGDAAGNSELFMTDEAHAGHAPADPRSSGSPRAPFLHARPVCMPSPCSTLPVLYSSHHRLSSLQHAVKGLSRRCV